MKKKLGVLTIGQSPRPDILDDLMPVFGDKIEIIEAGALDGMTTAEIQNLRPTAHDRMLVTRLSDGSVVHVAEAGLSACMQEKINMLQDRGAICILILCTARFSGLKSKVPCLEPGSILNHVVPLCAPRSAIGVLSPEPGQIKDTLRDWEGIVARLAVLTASPYGCEADLDAAAQRFGEMDIDLIVMDCMGYSESMRRKIAEVSGKPVILSKMLAAKVVSELLIG